MDIRKHNPIKWRENEMVLVTVFCLLGIAGHWWKIFEHDGKELRDIWGAAFTEHNLYFDFFVNFLLPQTGLLILIYGCYFWMNLYILPRLVQAEAVEPGSFRIGFSLRGHIDFSGGAGVTLKRFLWGLINAILLILILGAGWGIAIFYRREYDFLGMEWTGQANRVLGLGWRNSAQLVFMYVAYGFFRELSIRRLLGRPRENAFYIVLVNMISLYTAIYLGVGCVLYSFSIIGEQPFYFLFYGGIPPLVLAGLTNLYCIYPRLGEGSFWQRKNLRWVALVAMGWSTPFAVYLGQEFREEVAAFATLMGFQCTIAMPVSWLIFRSRREQFLRLRGLEAALGRSEADLKFLRSQINPHFLFNALNTLYGTALQEEASRTAGGIQQLGDMMRFMLHENNRDRIPMNKEVEYLRNYIALQRLRTDSTPSIRIDTDIEDVLPEAMIAPMLLIPFVENAFKHGISLREPSWVDIRLHGEGKQMLFEIRNSVHARKGDDPEKERSGIGLKNVLRRLHLVYPGKHSFFVNQDEREFFVQLMIEP